VDAVVNATSEQFNDRSHFTRKLATLAGEELGAAISRLEGETIFVFKSVPKKLLFVLFVCCDEIRGL
jgi:hypothetical protein